MKKVFLFCICYLVCCGAIAQNSTEDYFTITYNEDEQDPESEYIMLNVGVKGSRIYTGYNLDITLPSGVDVYGEDDGEDFNYWITMDEENGMYPYKKVGTKKTYSHSLSFSYGEVGERVLRVACFSSNNDNLKEMEGTLFQFFVKTSAFAKPGMNIIKISGGNLTAIEDGNTVKYVPADRDYEVLPIGSTSNIDININASNKFSTCVLPFDYTPDGFTAYTADAVSNGYVTLTEVSSMSAYTPYIIYKETGFSGNASGTVDASKYNATVTGGILTGAIEPQNISEGYVLQNKGDGSKFYNVNGQTFHIASGKCWIANTSEIKDCFGFNVNDETAIDEMQSTTNQHDTYDLTGRKVTNPQIGNIYIIDGRKVLKIQ